MTNDTKTLTHELDNLLWLEESVTQLAKHYDPCLGLLGCLQSVDESTYKSVLYDVEKLIGKTIAQLPEEKQQAFRTKLNEMQPRVECTLYTLTPTQRVQIISTGDRSDDTETTNMKWIGRYTHGITYDNLIFWDPTTTTKDELETKMVGVKMATNALQIKLPTQPELNLRVTQSLTESMHAAMIKMSKFEYICNGVEFLDIDIGTDATKCILAELQMVQQFCLTNQCKCIHVNAKSQVGYVDKESATPDTCKTM